MMFYSFYLLIVFVPFACYKYNIALVSHHTGSLYGFVSVNNGQNFLALCGCKSCKHVVNYSLRFFKTGIVARDNHAVAVVCGFACHNGAFAFVAVPSCTAHGYYFALGVAAFLQYFMNCRQNVYESIGSVGVVNDCCISARRTQGFESSCNAVEFT